MPVVTVTVNQWHIKDNAGKYRSERKPVICVNIYEWMTVDHFGVREWGPKIADTQHYHQYDVPGGQMVYDPEYKTPCGASCWMEYTYDA